MSAEESPPREDFWATLSPAAAASVVARGTTRTFARGHALMHEGQVPDRVLLLRSGRVKVFTTTSAGREVILALRCPGELVGELAALDDAPRSASVVALEPVSAVALTPADFRAFLLEHPAAALELLRMLTRRLRDSDSKRAEFAAFNTIARVARRLLELSERFGVPDDGAVRILVPLSQEELAGWTGASLESVGRALHTMRSLNWIATARREIRILDVDAVRRAAD